MRANPIKAMVAAGQTVANGWLAIPSSYSAEIMGHAGFDAVTVDLQHGMIAFEAALTMLQALSSTPATPLARVAKNDGALIMQLLDAGAYGIICPMVSTVAEAEALVAACRYPPKGQRSYGPARGLLYGGADYFAGIEDQILIFAMIETPEGLANLDAILAVDGLSGTYVGPNDMCLAVGVAPPRAEHDDPRVVEAIARVLSVTRRAGKIAGIYCSGAAGAAQRAREGFAIVTPGNDGTLLAAAAQAGVEAARGASASSAPSRAATGYGSVSSGRASSGNMMGIPSRIG